MAGGLQQVSPELGEDTLLSVAVRLWLRRIILEIGTETLPVLHPIRVNRSECHEPAKYRSLRRPHVGEPVVRSFLRPQTGGRRYSGQPQKVEIFQQGPPRREGRRRGECSIFHPASTASARFTI